VTAIRTRAADVAAIVLSLAVLYVGVRWGSTVAGGADSSGYVAESGLWREGALTVRQDIVRDSPWPLAQLTWTPLGFVPSTDAPDGIVPLYAPGYPLLMALMQIVGGYCAAFLVVPICGAVTIWSTYRLGVRVFGRPLAAVGGALVVATSPVFLYQLMNPMSDVPVTAAWTAALLLAVSNLPFSAGIAAAVAIAIRPNLAPLAGVLLVWLAITDRRAMARTAIGVAPVFVGIAWLNTILYGSPLASGYGSLGNLYAASYIPVNARLFATWTSETQTPIVLAALVYFVAPRLTAPERVPAARVLLGGTMAVVLVSYLVYVPFDAWWYLRFLLPMWPVVLLLTAIGIDAAARRWAARVCTPLTIGALLALSAYGFSIALERKAFDIGRSERQFLDVARYVGAHTEPNAVVLAMHHSGAIHIYADRATLRYDRLDPAWLDRAIEWLQASGRHPYIVLADFEASAFRSRFASASRIGALDWAPIAFYAMPHIAIYDAIDRSNAAPPLAIAATGRDRARWRCDPPQIWPPVLRMK